jgi:hypothetical protein
MADLTLQELKKLHDKAFSANQVTRERAADDRVFSWVTQWDDGLLQDSQLSYRGEFNIIRKAQRQIIGDLRSNPIQVDFVPKDDEREDGADLLDGLYITDDRRNSSLESYANASMEAVDCGVGGWELYTEYETSNAGDRNQVIRRRPIYEANNVSFPDPNAKLMDKSDAKYWSVLEPYSKDGYQDLFEELTGETTEAVPTNFADPDQSYTFPWVSGQNELYYIVRFFHKTKIKDKILTLLDPLGQPLQLRESDLTDVMDDLIDSGYTIDEEQTRSITRWQVKRYIASGERILKVEVVAGAKIPVVHTYGERTFVEGEEIWEGVVRLAKDPQRLRNFMLSYIADVVGRSPRAKPIFFPEQIAGYEFMYEENGADNNYPYLLQKRFDGNGNELPLGAVARLEGQEVPRDAAILMQETRAAVADVADPGLPQDIADPAISGKAVMALQARLDQQSIVYQQNLKHAKRWDGEIYAGMASVIYDAPRKVTLTTEDGQRNSMMIMDMVMDEESGDLVTLNDITNLEFDVFAEIGPSYTSKKEQTREELGELAMEFRETDPAMHMALNMKRLLLMDGVDLDDIRKYARKQLVLRGFDEPQNEEEEKMMEEAAQQQEQPDAATLLAMAEMKKADAEMMKQERESQKDQFSAQNDQAKTQIDAFRAQTDRYDVMVDAEKSGAEIQFTNAKTQGQAMDNILKMTDQYRGRVQKPPERKRFVYDPQSRTINAAG